MLALIALTAHAQQHHALRLVDPAGEPFRCADVETVHHVRYRTDDEGWVALYEPGLMGQAVWFDPSGPGVVAPIDWLGVAGFQLNLTEGGTTVVPLQRDGPSALCGRGDAELRLLAHGVPVAADHHAFAVVDADTGRPVPAVALTIDGRSWWTDNGGQVAYFDLDRMGATTAVEVASHGYSGQTLSVTLDPSGSTAIALDRVQIAERLVRLTGAGTWRDTALLGGTVPIAEPFLDSQVLGQDTTHVVPWRGGLFWLWGDTNRPSYLLGNFHATGALSVLDPTPEDGLDFDYLEAADGFVTSIAPSFAEGPMWLGGLVALSDDELWASYVNVGSDFEVFHEGIVRYNDATEKFVEVVRFGEGQAARPGGPAVLASGPEGDFVVYRSLHRVPADPLAMADATAYESYTPIGADGLVEQDADGVPVWRWRDDAPAPLYTSVGDGHLPRSASPWHQAQDPASGHTPTMHQGTLAFSAHRGRWIHVYTESGGSSALIGEIWYAEGDTPVGPWTWTTQVIRHDGYSFYNPMWHPWFASDGGRRVLFEGTYTHWLGTEPPTPRHDYNQQLYALDLDDPRMILPVAFYAGDTGPVAVADATRDGRGDRPQRFGAFDRPVDGSVPLRWGAPACDPDRTLSAQGLGETLLFAEPPGTTGPGRVALAAWDLPDGGRAYDITPPVPDAIRVEDLGMVHAPRWIPAVPLTDFDRPESADAGPDQCDVVSPVRVDAGASVLGGGIAGFTWSWAGGTASGSTAALALPPGLHVITLTVEGTDTHGVEVAVSDPVVVRVVDDEIPPPATPPSSSDPATPPSSDPVPPADARSCGCGPSGPAAPGWLLLMVLGTARSGERRRR